MQSIQRILRSRTLFIVFCIVVLYGLFGISGGLLDSRLGKAIWNMNHLIAFFIGNLFLYNIFPVIKPNTILNIVMVLIAMIVISGGIEFVQKHIGRSPSYQDIILNMAGSLLAIAVYLLLCNVKLFGRYFIAAMLFIVAMALTWPNIRFFIAEYINYQQFPVLADYSKPFALSSWRSGTARFNLNKSNELSVTFSPESDYSHIAYGSFYGQWNKYRELVIEINNPEPEQLDLIVRLHDKEHKKRYYLYEDRYFKNMELIPGENRIIIPIIDIFKAPKSRRMDLENLEELILFMSDLEQPRTIIIKKMYLR